MYAALARERRGDRLWRDSEPRARGRRERERRARRAEGLAAVRQRVAQDALERTVAGRRGVLERDAAVLGSLRSGLQAGEAVQERQREMCDERQQRDRAERGATSSAEPSDWLHGIGR